jgi:hypothetical protein
METRNWSQYIGWAAAILLMIGIGFQYNQLEETSNQVSTRNSKLKVEKN